jgi:transcriptional regulator with XRE-family HTH domain
MRVQHEYSHAAVVGARIKVLRKAQRLGTTELAARVGCVQQTISAIERGQYNTSIEQLGRIATALGVTLEGLVCGCGMPTPHHTVAEQLRAMADALERHHAVPVA